MTTQTTTNERFATTTVHTSCLSENYATGRRPSADLSFWAGPVESPQQRRALRARRTVTYVRAERIRRVR